MTTEAKAIKRPRYEFGRHETFALRYGWLSKGIEYINSESGGFRSDEQAVVDLGIGSRMVKSLKYWLEASGLAELQDVQEEGGRTARRLQSTRLAEVIRDRDPYLEYPASWWFVHLNLARRARSVWGWFFAEFRERNFDRATCVEAYLRYLRLHAANLPTLAVAQRDVACVLLSYGSLAADEPQDPEDGTASPLRELGLVIKHADTGRFERARPLDGVPMEAFLACVAAAAADFDHESLSVGEMIGRSGAPGTVLGLDAETIEDMSLAAVRDYPALTTFELHGGERRLRVSNLGADAWLDRHFQRVGGAS